MSAPVRRTGAAEGFTAPPPSAGPASTPAATAAQPVSALSAILALQATPAQDAKARTERALRRGTRALDALSGLERAMVGDGDLRSALQALKEATVESESADDPRLAGLLLEIETRRAVEEAKLDLASGLLDQRLGTAI